MIIVNNQTLLILYRKLAGDIEEAKTVKKIQSVIVKFYKVLAKDFENDLNIDIKKMFISMGKKLGIDLVIPAKTREVLINTKTKNLTVFNRLKLNSKKLLRDIVKKKLDITQRIKKEYNITKRIFNTGSHKIIEKAKFFFANKAKKIIEVNKKWKCRFIRSREAHIRLHNQIRKLDEDFTIDGYSTDYPGNFGIAKLDINCHCKVVYVKAGET